MARTKAPRDSRYSDVFCANFHTSEKLAKPTHYSIVQGPSKFDLMLALFDSMSTKPRMVTFEISSNGPEFQKIQVVVYGIERESGSGEDWNFYGYIEEGPFLLVYLKEKICGKRIRGYFSTKTRKGSMKIEE